MPNGRYSNAKGANRERYFAKKLKDWSGEDVLRTLSSGSGGDKATQGQAQLIGDLFFPLNSSNCFTYEVKDHASVKALNVLRATGEINSFWEQATTDCRRTDAHTPMLLVHVSREDDYVFVPYKKELEDFLFDNDLFFITRKISYEEKRTDNVYQYKVITTNLKSITEFPAKDLFKLYKNFDWDKLNHFKTTEKKAKNDALDIMDNSLKGGY